MKNLVILKLLILLGFPSILIAKELQSDSNHNGFLKVKEGIFIFPQNREGNALYDDEEKFVFSENGKTIVDANKIFSHFVVHLQDAEKNNFLSTTSEDIRIKNIKDYFILSNAKGYRKIYRFFSNEMQDILRYSRTGSGLKVNENNEGVFYHITKSENVENEEGENNTNYHFRLHLVKPNLKNQITLSDKIVNTQPYLTLNWEDQNSFSYTLADKTKEIITIPK